MKEIIQREFNERATTVEKKKKTSERCGKIKQFG